MIKIQCRECNKEITVFGTEKALDRALQSEKGCNTNVCRECLLGAPMDMYGIHSFIGQEPRQVDITVLTSDEVTKMPKKGSLMSDDNDHLRKSYHKDAQKRTKKQFDKMKEAGKTLQDYTDQISPR